MDWLVSTLDEVRPALFGYLTRLLVDPATAEDILQVAALKALQATDKAPADEEARRRWIFRIASNLAIDELRRRGRWREEVLIAGREAAETDQEFVAVSVQSRGSAEMKAIARQHLAFCFACTLRNLSPERSAALLLKEVHGFSLAETAEILEARQTQVKNWLQEARATMAEKYARTCALINKQGVCFQCSELSEFFNGQPENPLGSSGDVDARLEILRSTQSDPLNRWHRRLLDVFEELQ